MILTLASLTYGFLTRIVYLAIKLVMLSLLIEEYR